MQLFKGFRISSFIFLMIQAVIYLTFIVAHNQQQLVMTR